MTVVTPKLSWCTVRLGNDFNWWVKEISDPIHWDLDGLSILDPKQVAYILDLLDSLKDYGLNMDLLENAFFRFRIDKKLSDGTVRLVRTDERLLETEEPFFALPDVIDEDKGPYADFIDHITRLRVKMLNDVIDFEQNLSFEEIGEELRERYQQEFFEGSAIHTFRELIDILEYVPDGYELDKDEERANEADYESIDTGQDVDPEGELIEEDETMCWEEGEELEEEKEEGR